MVVVVVAVVVVFVVFVVVFALFYLVVAPFALFAQAESTDRQLPINSALRKGGCFRMGSWGFFFTGAYEAKRRLPNSEMLPNLPL